MRYCCEEDCKSALGKRLIHWRAGRPSEWLMDEFIEEAEQQGDEIARLRAELEAAKAEGERLDWLESHVNANDGLVLHNGGYKSYENEIGYGGLGLASTGRTLRAAIDDARGVK